MFLQLHSPPSTTKATKAAGLLGQITTRSWDTVHHLVDDRPSKRSKSKAVRCASGPARTHAVLEDAAVFPIGQVEHTEQSVFSAPKFGGSADVSRTLDVARRELYSKAKDEGANVLVDEQ